MQNILQASHNIRVQLWLAWMGNNHKNTGEPSQSYEQNIPSTQQVFFRTDKQVFWIIIVVAVVILYNNNNPATTVNIQFQFL